MAAIQTFKQRSETAGKVGSLSSDVLVSGHLLLPPEMTFYKTSTHTSITFQLTPCLADERALSTKLLPRRLLQLKRHRSAPAAAGSRSPHGYRRHIDPVNANGSSTMAGFD